MSLKSVKKNIEAFKHKYGYLDATKLETPRATPGERPKLSISIIFPLQL